MTGLPDSFSARAVSHFDQAGAELAELVDHARQHIDQCEARSLMCTGDVVLEHVSRRDSHSMRVLLLLAIGQLARAHREETEPCPSTSAPPSPRKNDPATGSNESPSS